eukprot:scaffold60935_cov54-Phaeocystis_antarctica.AAC.1
MISQGAPPASAARPVRLVARQRRGPFPLDLLLAQIGGTLLAHAPRGDLHRGGQLGVAPRRRVVWRDGHGNVGLNPLVLDRPPLAVDMHRVGGVRHTRAVHQRRLTAAKDATPGARSDEGCLCGAAQAVGRHLGIRARALIDDHHQHRRRRVLREA